MLVGGPQSYKMSFLNVPTAYGFEVPESFSFAVEHLHEETVVRHFAVEVLVVQILLRSLADLPDFG